MGLLPSSPISHWCSSPAGVPELLGPLSRLSTGLQVGRQREVVPILAAHRWCTARCRASTSIDGLSRRDAESLVAFGRELGSSAAGSGLVALGEVGIGNTTVASALAAELLGCDGRQTVGLGAGADTAMVDRKVAVVDAALRRLRRTHGHARLDPMAALTALGGPEFAVLAGVTLGASAAGAIVVLDGLATSVAALLAVRIEPAVAAHLIAAHRSREDVHALVLEELGQEPLLDLRIRAGEGAGACLAVPLLRAAAQTRRATARTVLRPLSWPAP